MTDPSGPGHPMRRPLRSLPS